MEVPNDSQRHLIIGRTGSGKTHFATWLLSLRSYDKMPWLVLNFKNDELLNSIPHAMELSSLKLPAPKKFGPGIYMARPDPDEDWEAIESLLRDAWQRTHVGVFIDEALDLSQPKHPYFRRLLRQGRSLKVPLVMGNQRPVDLDRYAFSESEYLSVLALSDDREVDKISEQTGFDLDMEALPEYHSYFLDRLKRKLYTVRPAPDMDAILDNFDRRSKKAAKSILI